MKECLKIWCERNCQSHPAMKRWGNKCMASSIPCMMEKIAISLSVINVLDRPLAEGEPFIALLTKAELSYCIQAEKRKSGRARLLARKKEMDKEKGSFYERNRRRAQGAVK
ncbi:hypothetical protein [Anaerosinus massiliensis]|uniref:hypothetical protein n=1 Tax=Massilibacillus massiliensis TaxID=1806837 RepID=UPI0018FE736F|nr:hypothetical protein [Massilibacillus massiliensis]